MTRTTLMTRTARLALACGALGLLAAGCDKGQSAATAPPLDALPLSTAVTPSAPAPATTRLPPARPAPLGRLAQPQDSYAYLDRAYAAADAYADAPPDYTVDYEGERPWIWRASDNSERVVERTPQGLRYYYYEPGVAQPYLVQDEGYTYAYSDGRLVAVYGPGGEVEPYVYVQRRADLAGRYLAWASALYIASQQQQRFAVERAHWDERRADIAAQRAAWSAQQSRDEAWAAYHQAHAAEEQAHWAVEQQRRNAEVVRYADAPPAGPGPAYGPGPAPYAGGRPNGGFNGGPAPYGAPPPYAGQAPYGGQAGFGGHRFTAYGPAQGGFGAPRFAQGGEPGRAPYDPGAPQVAAGVAAAQRQASFDQARAQAEAQRQAAEQAQAAQIAQAHQADVARRDEARAQAEQQRQQALQQSRAQAEAQRQAAEQAHAAQQQQARAAEAQRAAALQQSRAALEAQSRAAGEAHAAQAAQARAAAQAQREAHPGASNPPHEHPHGPPGEPARPGQQP